MNDAVVHVLNMENNNRIPYCGIEHTALYIATKHWAKERFVVEYMNRDVCATCVVRWFDE